MRVIPTLLEQQDVEMPMEVPGESATVKRGADAVADDEERPRLGLKRLKASEARNTTCKMSWNPRPRRRPGWSPGGVRNVKALNFSPRSGGRGREYNVDSSCCEWISSDSRRLELEYGCSCRSSVVVSTSVEDMVQPMSLFRRMLESNLPVLVQLDRCASMKARPETSRH